jgi:hypothetical protein
MDVHIEIRDCCPREIVALADIYGNGRPDILFVVYTSEDGFFTGALSVLPNHSNNR